ncbi:hypothetical protein [Gordonia aichiensis]
MFDDEDGVPAVAESAQEFHHGVDVGGMKADGRLVEDVQHLDQARAQMLHGFDALGFASGEGAGRPGEVEVSE